MAILLSSKQSVFEGITDYLRKPEVRQLIAALERIASEYTMPC